MIEIGSLLYKNGRRFLKRACDYLKICSTEEYLTGRRTYKHSHRKENSHKVSLTGRQAHRNMTLHSYHICEGLRPAQPHLTNYIIDGQINKIYSAPVLIFSSDRYNMHFPHQKCNMITFCNLYFTLCRALFLLTVVFV